MALPSDRLYTKSHEWLRIAGSEATVGITAYAQEQLGDVVFVELAPAGKQVSKGGVLGNIESVKAVSEFFAPAAGEVIAANGELEAHPELVNQDPYGKGWLAVVELADWERDRARLLDAEGYAALVRNQAEAELKA
jgi:glycine cleavage system H protein